MKLLVIAAVLCSTPAFADHPHVQLDLERCPSDADEIRRVIVVELGDLLSEVQGERTIAHVTCDGPLAILRVDDPITHHSLWRSVDLGPSTGAARPRLLALALVELIASSWTELPPPPAPPPPPPPPPAVDLSATPPSLIDAHEMVAPVAASVKSYVRITALAGGRRYSNMNVVAGAGLRIADNSQSWLGWMIDIQAHRGSQAIGTGRVQTSLLDGAAGAQLHRAWHGGRADGAVGVRGGNVQMVGMPLPSSMLQAGSLGARWFGAFALGHVGIAVLDRVTIDAVVGGGSVIVPVTGRGDLGRSVGVSGGWLEALFGIGVIL